MDLDAPNLFGQTPLFVASWQLGSGCPGQEVRFKMVCKFFNSPHLKYVVHNPFFNTAGYFSRGVALRGLKGPLDSDDRGTWDMWP